MDVLHTARATARGGREGEVVSDDGVLDLMLDVTGSSITAQVSLVADG